MDRLRHFEADNGRLRDQMRDMEHRQMTQADKLTDMERLNESLRNQVSDNDHAMTRFADEIR